MTVVFDTNTLLLIVRPSSFAARDAEDRPISHAKERVDGLVQELVSAKRRIIIPTPVLAEVLVRSEPGNRAALVEQFRRSPYFRVEPFDERAAIELADIERKALDGGDKRGGVEGPWTKIRFDRQIIAIGQVAGAETVYTDDRNLSKFAYQRGIRALGIGTLPIPMSAAQLPLPYDISTQRRAFDLSLDEDEATRGDRIA